MSCVDCYCGRKEMEAGGYTPVTPNGCGPGEMEPLLKAYEEGDITREAFLLALGAGK